MSDDWDGVTERRSRPHEYEFRQIICEELKPIIKNQQDIQAKISEWELAAKWFRVFIIGTVGLVTAVAGAYEWIRHHLK